MYITYTKLLMLTLLLKLVVYFLICLRFLTKSGTTDYYLNLSQLGFQILCYMFLKIYSEPSKRHKMEYFAKIHEVYNYFSKALYLRSLTGLWIRLSLNKSSLTCRVTSRYVLYDTYSENSGIFISYSHIFTYIVACSDPVIFRILAYLRPKIYSELCQSIFWHIQSAV